MSFELIVLAIGVLLALLSIFGAVINRKTSSELFGSKLTVTFGIIGICLIIYGGFSYGSINQMAQIEQVATATKLEVEYPVERIKIIYPVEGEPVQCRILTMGVYPEGHEKDILGIGTAIRRIVLSPVRSHQYIFQAQWRVAGNHPVRWLKR